MMTEMGTVQKKKGRKSRRGNPSESWKEGWNSGDRRKIEGMIKIGEMKKKEGWVNQM
jgi:hypothetical protein